MWVREFVWGVTDQSKRQSVIKTLWETAMVKSEKAKLQKEKGDHSIAFLMCMISGSLFLFSHVAEGFVPGEVEEDRSSHEDG
ncbi:MAG: hypothetical protein K0Q66_1087 [Chitinophagaceae bacterium]|nr:hypothetical protein [Chitinophagaceae bacterium]